MRQLITFILGSVLILSCVNTYGQTYADTIQANKFCKLADKYCYEFSLDSSTIYYRKAADIYKSIAEIQKDTTIWHMYLECLSVISTNFSQQYKYSDSKNTLDSALAISLKIFGSSHKQTALIYHCYGSRHITCTAHIVYILQSLKHPLKCFGYYPRIVNDNYLYFLRCFHPLPFYVRYKGRQDRPKRL